MKNVIRTHNKIEKEGFTNNSHQEHKGTAREMRYESSFHFAFNINQNLKYCIMVAFTIFSIMLPIAIGPHVIFNYVFAQSDPQSENEKLVNNDVNDISYSSTPSFTTELIGKDPFSSSGNNINDKSENSLLSDRIESDGSASTDSSSVTNSQYQSESSLPQEYNSFPDNVNSNDNNGQSTLELSNKPSAQSSSVDAQMFTSDTITNNLDQGTNESDVSDNQSTIDEINDTAISQSISEPPIEFETDTQPTYKSYRDFMDNNDNSSIEESDDMIEKPRDDEPSSAEPQILTSDNKIKLNLNTKNDVTIYDSNDQSDTQSGSENSGSEIKAQLNQKVYGDFNGDGMEDLAIGVPLEDVNIDGSNINDAGAVNVLYGSSSGLSATSVGPDQIWTQDSPGVNNVPEEGDLFGSSLSTGDFNGDGKDDLAIGVESEDIDSADGNMINAGAVNVLYGSSSGLSATSPRSDQFWTQDSPGVNNVPEEGDLFGSSLSTGDFNGDGKDDLNIGMSAKDGTISALSVDGADSFYTLYGSSSGLSAKLPNAD